MIVHKRVLFLFLKQCARLILSFSNNELITSYWSERVQLHPSDFLRQKSYSMTHGTIFHPTCRIRHFVSRALGFSLLVWGTVPYDTQNRHQVAENNMFLILNCNPFQRRFYEMFKNCSIKWNRTMNQHCHQVTDAVIDHIMRTWK